MATRRRPPEAATTEIPIDLYRGLAVAIETGYPNGGPSSREMGLWSKRVRAAGYLTDSLIAVADADEGFQRWLFQHERRRRLCAEEKTSR